jgi:PAT family beta-lactamase induction signal transducer AmpG
MAGAGILLLLALVVLRAPAAELVASERKLFLTPFLRWLAKPGSIPTLAFVLLYKLGDQAISPMIRPFWVDSGRTIQEIAWVSNTFGIGATIVGALIGGFWTMRLGLIRGLVVMGIFQASSNLGYAVVALTGALKLAVYGASVWESFTQGLGTAAFLSLLMRLCDKEHAGVQYALLSALFSLARHVAGAASGWAADRLGFGIFALYTVLLSAPAFLLLPWVKKRVQAVDR